MITIKYRIMKMIPRHGITTKELEKWLRVIYLANHLDRMLRSRGIFICKTSRKRLYNYINDEDRNNFV